MLDDKNTKRLEEIIWEMKGNDESDTAIEFLVGEFKNKHKVPNIEVPDIEVPNEMNNVEETARFALGYAGRVAGTIVGTLGDAGASGFGFIDEKRAGAIGSVLDLIGREDRADVVRARGTETRRKAKIVGKDSAEFWRELRMDLYDNLVKDTDSFKEYQRVMEEREKIGKDSLFVEDFANWNQWTNDFLPAISDSIGIMIAALVGTKGAKLIPKIAGMTAISTDMESRMEAQGKYQEILQEGGTPEEAMRQADNVYNRNVVALLGTNLIESMIITRLIGAGNAGLLKGGIKGFAKELSKRGADISAGVLVNVLEERLQVEISGTAAKDKLTSEDYRMLLENVASLEITRADLEAGLIGGVQTGSVYFVSKAMDLKKRAEEKFGKKKSEKFISDLEKAHTETQENASSFILQRTDESVKEQAKKTKGEDGDLVTEIIKNNPEHINEILEGTKKSSEVFTNATEEAKNISLAFEKASTLQEQGASRVEIEIAVSGFVDENTTREILKNISDLEQEFQEKLEKPITEEDPLADIVDNVLKEENIVDGDVPVKDKDEPVKDVPVKDKGKDEPVKDKEKDVKDKDEPVKESTEISAGGFTITAEDIEKSYRNLSFRSGQGVAEIKDLEDLKQSDWEDLLNVFNETKKPEISKEELQEQFDRYWKGKLKREKSIVDARSRTASSMITGAANFPVEKNRRAMEIYMRRNNEILDFRKKVLKAIKTKIKGSGIIKAGDSDVISKLENKVVELEKTHNRLKKGNIIIRKYKGDKAKTKSELLNLGFTEENLITSRTDGSFMKFFTGNSGAKLRTAEKRLSTIKKTKEVSKEGKKDYSFKGGKVVFNGEIMRIQVFFDEKPNEEMRDKLKTNAFKWSPKNNAWQRALNNRGAYVVSNLFPIEQVSDTTTFDEEIKALEKELRVAYSETEKTGFEQFTRADEELSNIAVDLELAEAGSRLFIPSHKHSGYDISGIPSTFPKWIPENLRSKKLFDNLLGGLEISKLSYPKGNRTKQRELFHTILTELDNRLGIDTSIIRDNIIKKYDKRTKKETAITTDRSPESREEKNYRETGEIKFQKKAFKSGFISTKEALAKAKELPFFRNLPIKEVKSILGGKGFGSYIKGTGLINFVKDPHETTLPHEAFHAFVDLVIDKKTKQEVWAEYRSKNPELNDNQIEEIIAQEYAEWFVKTRKNFSSKVIAFFKKIANELLSFSKQHDKILSLFESTLTQETSDVMANRIRELESLGGIEVVREQFQEDPVGFTTKLTTAIGAVGKKEISYGFLKETVAKTKKKGLNKAQVLLVENTMELPQFKDNKKIDVQEFLREIKSELLEMSIIESDTYANHGLSAISRNQHGEDNTAKTTIINTNFLHGERGHFSGAFDKTTKKEDLEIREIKAGTHEIEGETQVVDKDQFYVVRKDLDRESLESGVFDKFDTEKEAQEYIDKFADRRVEEAGMLGHFRKFESEEYRDPKNLTGQFDNIYYITEMQSDVFQKPKVMEKLDRTNDRLIAQETKKHYDKIQGITQTLQEPDVTSAQKSKMEEMVAVEKKKIKEIEEKYKTEGQYFFGERYENRIKLLITRVESHKRFIEKTKKKVQKESIVLALRKSEQNLREDEAELKQLKTRELTPEQQKEIALSEQFLSLKNNYHETLIKTSIRQAAMSGASIIRFPTPMTVAYVEEFVSAENIDEGGRKEMGSIEIGDEATNHLGEEGIVIDMDEAGYTLAFGEKKEVRDLIIETIDEYASDSDAINTDFDGILEFFIKELTPEQQKEFSDVESDSIEDLSDFSATDLENAIYNFYLHPDNIGGVDFDPTSEYEYFEVNDERFAVINQTEDNFTETWLEKQDINTFKLADIKDDGNRAIAGKYGVDEHGNDGLYYKYLKKTRTDLKELIDDNDFTWWESEITPEDKGAVVMFQTEEQIKPVEKEVYVQQESSEFLKDLQKRLGIDFDVHYVNTILSHNNQEAFGATLDNTIVILKNLTDTTEHHEAVHITLANLNNIEALKNFSREGLLKAQAKSMGIYLTKENEAMVEEALATGMEKYVTENKRPSERILRKFFRKLKELLTGMAQLIHKTDGAIIKDYYDTLLFAENVYDRKVRLENEGLVESLLTDELPFAHQELLRKRKELDARWDNASFTERKQIEKATALVMAQLDTGAKFKLKEETDFKNLKDKYNKTIILQQQIDNEIVTKKDVVEMLVGDKASALSAKETLKAYRELNKMRHSGGKEKGRFNDEALQVIDIMGETVEGVENKLKDWSGIIAEQKEIQATLTSTRKEVSELKKESKDSQVQKNELRRRLLFANIKLKLLQDKINLADRFGRTYDDTVDNYKKRIAQEIIAISQVGNLKDYELTKRLLESDKIDFEKMSDEDFYTFTDDLIKLSKTAIDKQYKIWDVQNMIAEKQIKKVNNLLGIMFKTKNIRKLSKQNLDRLKEALNNLEDLDIILPVAFMKSIRKFSDGDGLVASDLTTYRELAKDLNVTDLTEIKNKPGQRILNNYSLRKLSTFHKKVAETVMTAQIISGRKAEVKIEKLVEVMKEARKSRGVSIKGIFAKWDAKISDYIQPNVKVPQLTAEERKKTGKEKEALILAKTEERRTLIQTERENLAKDMTAEEVTASHFIIDLNLDYSVKIEELYGVDLKRFKGVYIPHSLKTFLQSILYLGKNEKLVDGVMNAFKNIFAGAVAEQELKIGEVDTSGMLAYEKFFGNFLKREGNIDPNLDLISVMSRYISSLETKMEVDKYRPYLIGIAKIAETKEGTSSMVPFLKEYLNNAVGHKTSKSYIKQGSKVDVMQDALISFVIFRNLWASLTYNIANLFGMSVATSTLLYRYQDFKNLFLNMIKGNLFRSESIWNDMAFQVEETPYRKLFKKDDITAGTAINAFGHLGIGYARSVFSRINFMILFTPEQLANTDKITEHMFVDAINVISAFDRIRAAKPSIVGSSTDVKVFRVHRTWAIPFLASSIQAIIRLTHQSYNAIKNKDPKEYDEQDIIYLRRFTSGAIYSYLLLSLLINLLRCDEEDKFDLRCRVYRTIIRDANLYREALGMFTPVVWNEVTEEWEIDVLKFAAVPLTILVGIMSDVVNIATGAPDIPGTDINKGWSDLKTNVTPRGILQFTGRVNWVSIRDDMREGLIDGSVTPEEFAKYENDSKAAFSRMKYNSNALDWEDLEEDRKKIAVKEARALKALYIKFDDDTVTKLLSQLSRSRINVDRATVWAKEENKEIFNFVTRNDKLFCDGLSKSGNNYIGCMISKSLQKAINEAKKN